MPGQRSSGIIHDQRGATAVEYGLILALIALAIMGALTLFADTTISMWNSVAVNVSTATGYN